jgi:hypothetical protein
MEFVVMDKVALRFFSPITSGLPISIIPELLHTNDFIYHGRYARNFINKQRR